MVEPEANLEEVVIHESPAQFVGYSNLNRITITAEEVVVHFGLRRTNSPNEADGVAKMILSLPHAKRVLIVLAQLFQEHELMFGEVQPDYNARLTPEGVARVKALQETKEREKKDA